MSRGRWWHSGGGQVWHSRVWGILLSQHQPSKCILSRHPTFEGGKFQKLQHTRSLFPGREWGWAGSRRPPLSCLGLPLTCQQHGLCGGSRYLSSRVPCQVGQVVSRVQILSSCLCVLHWLQPLPVPSSDPSSQSQQACTLPPSSLFLPPFPFAFPSSLPSRNHFAYKNRHRSLKVYKKLKIFKI